LRAGQDTSEWAIECLDVSPIVQHHPASIFASWNNVRAGFPTCQGHSFVTSFPIERRAYREIQLDSNIDEPGVLDVLKLSLTDSGNSHQVHAITSEEVGLSSSARWQQIEKFDGLSIYKNLRALPRAWFVSKVVSAQPLAILNAIRTSLSPDGTAFDPRSTAFVEEPFTLTSDERVEAAPPEIVEASNSRIVINTRARDVRFLVLSDVYYPGWIASIDGHETKVFRADYALRGIAVPAGPHEVVFEYRPLSFYVGLTIGMAGIVVLLAIALRMRRSNKSP